jgi:hypothetical protein
MVKERPLGRVRVWTQSVLCNDCGTRLPVQEAICIDPVRRIFLCPKDASFWTETWPQEGRPSPR